MKKVFKKISFHLMALCYVGLTGIVSGASAIPTVAAAPPEVSVLSKRDDVRDGVIVAQLVSKNKDYASAAGAAAGAAASYTPLCLLMILNSKVPTGGYKPFNDMKLFISLPLEGSNDFKSLALRLGQKIVDIVHGVAGETVSHNIVKNLLRKTHISLLELPVKEHLKFLITKIHGIYIINSDSSNLMKPFEILKNNKNFRKLYSIAKEMNKTVATDGRSASYSSGSAGAAADSGSAISEENEMQYFYKKLFSIKEISGVFFQNRYALTSLSNTPTKFLTDNFLAHVNITGDRHGLGNERHAKLAKLLLKGLIKYLQIAINETKNVRFTDKNMGLTYFDTRADKKAHWIVTRTTADNAFFLVNGFETMVARTTNVDSQETKRIIDWISDWFTPAIVGDTNLGKMMLEDTPASIANAAHQHIHASIFQLDFEKSMKSKSKFNLNSDKDSPFERLASSREKPLSILKTGDEAPNQIFESIGLVKDGAEHYYSVPAETLYSLQLKQGVDVPIITPILPAEAGLETGADAGGSARSAETVATPDAVSIAGTPSPPTLPERPESETPRVVQTAPSSSSQQLLTDERTPASGP